MSDMMPSRWKLAPRKEPGGHRLHGGGFGVHDRHPQRNVGPVVVRTAGSEMAEDRRQGPLPGRRIPQVVEQAIGGERGPECDSN